MKINEIYIENALIHGVWTKRNGRKREIYV